MKNSKKYLIIVIALIVIVGGMIVPKYNKLVALDNNVDAQYAQVQVVVKRRADLIPNLVNTVKGYATHEEETFENVAKARAGIDSATNIEELSKANNELTRALGSMNVVAERYPELKANDNFMGLQSQLEGSENRISIERQRYNETIKEYNNTVRSFPMNIFAKMLGFEKKAFFEISEQDMETPEVNF